MSAPKVTIWRKWPDGEVVGVCVRPDGAHREALAVARVNALEAFREAVDGVRAEWAGGEEAAAVPEDGEAS